MGWPDAIFGGPSRGRFPCPSVRSPQFAMTADSTDLDDIGATRRRSARRPEGTTMEAIEAPPGLPTTGAPTAQDPLHTPSGAQTSSFATPVQPHTVQDLQSGRPAHVLRIRRSPDPTIGKTHRCSTDNTWQHTTRNLHVAHAVNRNRRDSYPLTTDSPRLQH